MSNALSNKILLEVYAKMTVALRIKQRREQLGLKQSELALISKISQAQVSKYESGTHEPNAHALYQLAMALNTSADWLIGLTDEVNEIKSDEELSDIERKVLRIMRSKSPDQQQRLFEIMRML
jgi:transcriptional regulator with XRE-family HTH domain